MSTDATARPAASVKSVLIGSVPDRGGRTDESRGAATMPAWSERRANAGVPHVLHDSVICALHGVLCDLNTADGLL